MQQIKLFYYHVRLLSVISDSDHRIRLDKDKDFIHIYPLRASQAKITNMENTNISSQT